MGSVAALAIILALGPLGAPLAACAQPAGKIYRVGVLWPGGAPPRPPRMETFRDAPLIGEKGRTPEA
jgi:hypothetical protein